MLTRIRKWWERRSHPVMIGELPVGKIEHKIAPYWHAHGHPGGVVGGPIQTTTPTNAVIMSINDLRDRMGYFEDSLVDAYKKLKLFSQNLEPTPIFDSMSTYLSESSPIFDKLAMEWA